MTIAAEYTNGSKTRHPTLDIVRIQNGQRDWLLTLSVAGKVEARKLAKAHGAKPWNF